MSDDGSQGGRGNDGGRGGSDDGNGGPPPEQSGDEGPSTMEKVVMVVSVTFTVLLFAYVVWQAAVTPSGVAPEANVIGTSQMADGDVRVNVEIVNSQDIGLLTATVEVDCTTPAPSVDFQHVPADGRMTGYLTCPPGTSNATASVSAWIEA